MKHTLENYRAEYLRNWHDMTIRPSRMAAVRASAGRILANRARYEAVEAATGVPWFVVGVIHKMECPTFPAFDRHLHNGDPLTRRTRLVPAGRPKIGNPPFTWEESAIDALKMPGKNFDRVAVWDLPRIAYSLELYNGWGYRSRGVASPYLWSFSTAYTSGKFVADHVYSASAVSGQSGALVLLRALCDMDADVRGRVYAPEAAPPPEADESEVLPRTPSMLAALWRSRTLLGSAIAGTGLAFKSIVEWVADTIGNPAAVLAEVASEAGGLAASLSQIGGMLGLSLAGVGVAAILYGLAVVVFARVSAEGKGKTA